MLPGFEFADLGPLIPGIGFHPVFLLLILLPGQVGGLDQGFQLFQLGL